MTSLRPILLVPTWSKPPPGGSTSICTSGIKFDVDSPWRAIVKSKIITGTTSECTCKSVCKMYYNIIIIVTRDNTSHQSTRYYLYITVNMKPTFSQNMVEDGCPVLLEFNSEGATLFFIQRPIRFEGLGE